MSTFFDFFFFQAEDGIRDYKVTGVQTCALPIYQVLSFGTEGGPVTAQQVREVLGLIPDDLYGEMLRLVAERDAKAVFPLVGRLGGGGADPGGVGAGARGKPRARRPRGVGGAPPG